MKYLHTIIIVLLIVTNSFSQSWEIYNKDNSEIPSNNVTSISISENGTIWIGTLSGIASFNNSWEEHTLGNTYNSEAILNVWAENDTIWVGTEFRGLWSYDGVNSWVHYHSNSIGNGIIGFGLDSNNTIWILDKFGNFEMWDGNDWIEINDFFTQGTDLFIDNLDNIWLLSNTIGYEKYFNGNLLIDNTWNPSSTNYFPEWSIHKMIEDNEGNYWVGGNNIGLIKIDGNEVTNFDVDNSGIPSNKIRALVFDENNNLWIGTLDNGISKYDGSTWENYNIDNSPLLSNLINDIVVGNDGKIWIAHGYDELMLQPEGQGIVVFDEDGLMTNVNSESNNELKKVKTYPNPFHEQIIVETPNISSHLNIELTDLNGRVLIEEHISSQKSSISTHSLTAGIYILKLRNQKTIEIRKIIKH